MPPKQKGAKKGGQRGSRPPPGSPPRATDGKRTTTTNAAKRRSSPRRGPVAAEGIASKKAKRSLGTEDEESKALDEIDLAIEDEGGGDLDEDYDEDEEEKEDDEDEDEVAPPVVKVRARTAAAAAVATGTGEEDNDALADHLDAIQGEKDMIDGHFLPKAKNLVSAVWNKVLFLNLPAILNGCNVENQDKHGFSGIKKLREYAASEKIQTSLAVCCAICFQKPNVHLKDAIVMLVLKKPPLEKKKKEHGHRSPTMSNFQTHLERRDDEHRAFLEEAMNTNRGRSVSGNASVGTARSGAHSTTAGQLVDSSLHPFTEWTRLPKAQIITRIHQMIYVLVNDSNIPSYIVRNPRLWELVEFIVANGTSLRGTSLPTLTMGRHKFNTIQAVSFGTMVNTVERLIADTRQTLSAGTGRNVPFIYIGHDIWDGKSKSVLGLCVFFVSPLLKQLVKIPVAILRSEGHTSDEVAEQSLEALLR